MSDLALRPSASDRWRFCTASVEAESSYEDTTSSYAQEGTEAHDLLERAIKAKTRPSELEPEHHATKDVDQAYFLVEPYLNDKKFMVLSEVKVRFSESCSGTADVIVINLKTGHLTVIDYKHGRGVLVEPDCTQLLIYLFAAYKTLGFMVDVPIRSFEAIIVQPRAAHPDGPIRSEEYTKEAILDAVKPIIDSINDIKTGNTKFCPTDKGCKFCKFAGNCPALAKKSLEAVGAHFTDLGMLEVPEVSDIKTLTIEQKSAILEARGLLDTFVTAIEKEAMATLEAGGEVPGFKLVAGRSQRKWGGSDEEITDLCKNQLKLKQSQYAPPKLLGPAAIEKLIDVKARGGKRKLELFQQHVIKPEGKPTIVPESDKRQAITPHFAPVVDPLA